MSNTLIGVSPPQLGKAKDSKVDLRKDLNEASPGQYKNDFENTLKEKLAAKEKTKDAETSPPGKEARFKKKDDKEFEVEQKKEKSPGGTKKRVTDKVDEQIVSMLMASQESEVETPKSKTDLAEISENQQQEQFGAFVAAMPAAKATVAPELSELIDSAKMHVAAGSISSDMMQKIQQQLADMNEVQPKMASEIQQIKNSFIPKELQQNVETEQHSEEVQPPMILPQPEMMEAQQVVTQNFIAEEVVQVEPRQDAEGPVKELMQKLQTEIETKSSSPTEQFIPIEAAPVAVTAFATAIMPKSTSNFEQELNEEVGFEPNVEHVHAKKESSETENKPVSLKAQQFEKSVFEQLQKMDPRSQQPNVQEHATKDQPKQDDVKLEFAPTNATELHHVGQTHSEFKTLLAAPVFAGSEQHRVQLLEQHHEKNIQEVMNQAQYLVKKGGGEMKVNLSPEGMGEMQLKVMLQDGKVNIEMRTQDKAVKKLMEDSLTDLRSGLAAQHLNLEHVKINSVSATNTDNSTQFQSNWNQSGREHQQREYWNQYSQRRSSYATSSTTTQPSMDVKSVKSVEEVAPRTYGGTKGSQINWVA